MSSTISLCLCEKALPFFVFKKTNKSHSFDHFWMPSNFLFLFISRLKEPQGWVGSGKPTLSSQREKTSRLPRQKQHKVLMWERHSNRYTLILQSLPAPTAQTETSLVKTSIPPLCSRPFRQLRRAPEQNRHSPSYTKGQALWKGENETEKLKADSHH